MRDWAGISMRELRSRAASTPVSLQRNL